jgi:hypothetical protein
MANVTGINDLIAEAASGTRQQDGLGTEIVGDIRLALAPGMHGAAVSVMAS